jgi:hypothetical protein
VQRIIYLGGLEANGATSAHLKSREEVARILAEHVPETVTCARRWSSAAAAPRS